MALLLLFAALAADPRVGYLNDLCRWILTLEPGTGELKNTSDTPWSIFINGNFARVLMAAHQITGDARYRDEAVRWADTFVGQQRQPGFWAFDGKERDIYFGDTGTAVTALARIARQAPEKKRAAYIEAMRRYARFVAEGCAGDPQGKGRGGSPGWINKEGAVGCGYYGGHVSTQPYTIATATTGGAFFSELYSLTKDPTYRRIAAGAVRWLLARRKPDGEIPYTLDGKANAAWPLDTMTYCAEAFVAAYTLLGDRELNAEIVREIRPSIEWLLRTQNPDGAWGKLRSQDQQRSPGVVTLLAWYHRSVRRDPRVRQAIARYTEYLLKPENSRAYGVKQLVRTSGFVGLVFADLIRPGSTL